jgi:hypothetical protein
VTVDAAAASAWLGEQLALPIDDGVLTVIWHSTTRQYWPLPEITAVDAIISAARDRMPIAHVAMESPVSAADIRDRPGHRPAELTVQLSVPGVAVPEVAVPRVAVPGVAVPRAPSDAEPRRLGTVHDHGVPVRLAQAAS